MKREKLITVLAKKGLAPSVVRGHVVAVAPKKGYSISETTSKKFSLTVTDEALVGKSGLYVGRYVNREDAEKAGVESVRYLRKKAAKVKVTA